MSGFDHFGAKDAANETSSQETYAPTIRFYKRAGYELIARIRNFYRIGDDKLVFVKRIDLTMSEPRSA